MHLANDSYILKHQKSQGYHKTGSKLVELSGYIHIYIHIYSFIYSFILSPLRKKRTIFNVFIGKFFQVSLHAHHFHQMGIWGNG